MLNLRTISTAVAAIAMCGVFVAPAAAQRGYQENRSRYNQRTWQISTLIADAERTSNAFRQAVERRDWQTNDRRGTTSRERFFDSVTPHVRRLDEAFERLRSEAGNNRPRAGRDDMIEVLRHARMVDRYFVGSGFTWGGRRLTYTRSNNLNARWADLRRDINALARAYGLNGIR